MPQHLAECPLEHVPCRMKDAGCKEMVMRKDLKNHVDRNLSEHLQFAYKKCTVLNEEQKKLKTAESELQTKHETTLAEL